MTPLSISRNISPTFSLDAYDYYLPESLIAQNPPQSREASRLLIMGRGDDLPPAVGVFNDVLEHLPRGSLIVVNNSRVVPGRLRTVGEHGGGMELLLLTPLNLLRRDQRTVGARAVATSDVLLRPAKKARVGKVLNFSEIQVTVLEKGEFGQTKVELSWPTYLSLEEFLRSNGEIPLPPYIRRPSDQRDLERYQTVYADEQETGSIAAPTAGLHFTPLLRDKLIQAGHEWAEVTLYVGYGTFSPIRCDDIRDHRMHGEYVKITQGAAEAVRRAKQEGRAIVAVGTTSLRTLEGVAAVRGGVEPFEGWLDTYIYPGFSFQVVDGLITNFHLPKSSLLVLVSAFAGRERILAAYRRAMAEGFRFFSYGDAMFIRP
ncbi:tRNA preQ1(34) S-adenosylmethionine ribosyltransferase-isomerase QueA [Desulfonatronum sp. SC1]|uniref:tRNA preQ1(34) S-adenosylmethionine ribosyltransferase-isomerase QueA n=1 Tax=Desulfonatronum sp. SC1 TaxID=2109626 RepID=UPI000D2F674A|nr:tRNA preQ1(34) S-adenosylmethionine ribosyltransferase-isomerase QueA [Desulfonatronum sp. SC1]PTN36532.1 tRNA preQ1(34) S-adenosylmethionine ribosyltransferase-isomerase QueA [Desulfonatronum sp. SC1]